MSEPVSTNQVRAYCDGELDAEQTRSIEQRAEVDPDLAARIRFERALRESVERALVKEIGVPTEVRERVRAVLAGQVESSQVESSQVQPPRANVFAVAASLALVAGAILFGIFGKPIDRMGPTTGALTDVAEYAAAEHQRCAAHPEALQAKARFRTAAAADPYLVQFLGSSVSVDGLAPAGYQFVGASIQALPGQRTAAHLIYALGERGEDGCPDALLSVFLVPDVGQFDGVLGDLPWNWFVAADRPDCTKRVLATSDGSLVYFLICCNQSQIGDLAVQIAE